MKWPLRWRHQFGREALCLLVGHRWKYSWRSRDDRADREARSDHLTYREREEGNPFCWYSAGWSVKCRRCRDRSRDKEWHPFWLVAWWIVKRGAVHGWWNVQWLFPTREPGKWYMEVSRPYRELAFILAWPVAYLESLAVHVACDTRWPVTSLFDWALTLEFWYYGWVERHSRHFDWIDADPNVPHSIGFWMWRDESQRELTATVQTFNPPIPESVVEDVGGRA